MSRFSVVFSVLIGLSVSLAPACTTRRTGTQLGDGGATGDGSTLGDGGTDDGGACVTECALDGIKRCGTGERAVEVCRVTSPGCGSWQAAPSCSSQQFCQAGECVNLCIRGQVDKSTYCDQLRMATCNTIVRCCEGNPEGCSSYTNDERTSIDACSNSSRIWGAECPNEVTLPVACQEDVLDCANAIFLQECAPFFDDVLPSFCDTAWFE